VQSLVVPFGQSGNVVRWAPDDKALNYVSTVGSTGNIWSLPLDGTAPHQVTNFNSYSIDNFVWAPDGKRLAVTRSEQLSDVILIENSPAP
jgi:Tol biopolymer transport system component